MLLKNILVFFSVGTYCGMSSDSVVHDVTCKCRKKVFSLQFCKISLYRNVKALMQTDSAQPESVEQRQDTPWTGRQFITVTISHIHTLNV